MENAEANKALVLKMFGDNNVLEDFPGNAKPNIVIHEPSSLPFGGTYHGLDEFSQLYPKVSKFYDPSRSRLLNAYADGDVVFVIMQAGVAGTEENLLVCEQFTFEDGKIAEIRVFIHDYAGKPVHTLVHAG
jgi:predicted SnoaL-like aldol condensation-catalyzing enzyme